MRVKIKLNILVPSILIVFMISNQCLANAASELAQADSHMKNLQYQQAVAGYKAIVTNYPGSDYALKAQKNLAVTYIRMLKLVEPQDAIDKLQTDFAGNPDLPAALYDIAGWYKNQYPKRFRQYQRAKAIYQQIMANYPENEFAQKSQGCIYQLDVLMQIESGDISAARQATEKLKTDFAESPELPKLLWQIARKYDRLLNHERLLDLDNANSLYPNNANRLYLDNANSLYLYVAQHYPDTQPGRISQLDLDKINIIRLVSQNKDSQAQTALDTLISNLQQNPSLPGGQILKKIGRRCDGFGKYSQAAAIHPLIGQLYPGSRWALRIPLELVKCQILADIDAGNYTTAQAATDKLETDYPGHEYLQRIFFRIGVQYERRALLLEHQGQDAAAQADFQKAIGAWQKAIDSGPDPIMASEAAATAGNCCMHIGGYQGVINYFGKISNDYPGSYWGEYVTFMVGRSWQKLKETGQVSVEQADPQTRAVYQRLVDTWPDCKAAPIANKWLKKNILN
jgi:outer membrane protein assembly factor BamD (BamD/ComL family)